MTIPGDVYIYVSPTGNDANLGTQTAPVQTLGKALSLVPCGYQEVCRIVLAPGTYTETSPISFHPPHPVGPYAIDFAIVGEMHSVLGDRTCSAADPTFLTYTDSTLPPVAVDAFIGATLFCASGANKGASRTIVSNTAAAFTINKPWTTAPAIGDVFQVQQPAVVINHAGILFWGPGPIVCLQYLKFHSVSATANFGADFLVKLAAESVEMDLNGASFALLHYCGIIAGTELASPGISPPSSFPLIPFSLIRQADWYIHGGTLSFTDRCQVSNQGGSNNLVTANLSILCADSCTFAANSIFGRNTDISLVNFSSINHPGIAAHPSSLSSSNVNPVTLLPNPYLIKADKNSIIGGGNAGLRHIALDNSGGDAILLQGNSHGYIGDVTGVNLLGVGIHCTSMSTARVHQGGMTTVTGPGPVTGPGSNNVSVGGVIKQYVGAPGVSIPFTNTDTLCRIEP